MAKIRVTGIQEMIEVSNEDLKDFVSRRNAKQITNDDNVSLGNWGGKASEVRSWILDGEYEPDTSAQEREKKYQDDRRRLMSLSPVERAEESIGYIRLFCQAAFGKDPSEENEKKIIGIVREFFEKNPLWAIPSIRMLYQRFGIDTKKFNRKIDKYEDGCLQILERCELQELTQIKNDNKAGKN